MVKAEWQEIMQANRQVITWQILSKFNRGVQNVISHRTTLCVSWWWSWGYHSSDRSIKLGALKSGKIFDWLENERDMLSWWWKDQNLVQARQALDIRPVSRVMMWGRFYWHIRATISSEECLNGTVHLNIVAVYVCDVWGMYFVSKKIKNKNTSMLKTEWHTCTFQLILIVCIHFIFYILHLVRYVA